MTIENQPSEDAIAIMQEAQVSSDENIEGDNTSHEVQAEAMQNMSSIMTTVRGIIEKVRANPPQVGMMSRAFLSVGRKLGIADNPNEIGAEDAAKLLSKEEVDAVKAESQLHLTDRLISKAETIAQQVFHEAGGDQDVYRAVMEKLKASKRTMRIIARDEEIGDDLLDAARPPREEGPGMDPVSFVIASAVGQSIGENN